MPQINVMFSSSYNSEGNTRKDPIMGRVISEHPTSIVKLARRPWISIAGGRLSM